jgi:hypothetical protein
MTRRGGTCDIEDRDRPVGADDGERAVAILDVDYGSVEEMCRHALARSNDEVRRLDGGAAAPALTGGTPVRYRCAAPTIAARRGGILGLSARSTGKDALSLDACVRARAPSSVVRSFREGPLCRLSVRPAHEKPYIVFPVGFPAENCAVPDIPKSPAE